MKRTQRTRVLVLAAVSAALCGCSTANVAFHKFPTTTFPEVVLDSGASIRVVARDGAGKTAQAFAEALAKELASDGGFRIAKDGERADYWFLVEGRATYRPDTSEQVRFDTSYVAVPKGDDNGGRDEIVRTAQKSYSSARGMSVAVYRAEGLAPVHYLELPVWEGRIGPNVEIGKEQALETDSRFANLALERVKDVFLTQTKTVSVPVPRQADPALYKAFVGLDKAVRSQTDSDTGASLSNAQRRNIEAAFSSIERRAAELLPDPIDVFAEKRKKGEWKGSDEEAETILANYYIRALAREAGCLDPEKLRAVYSEQLRILELSTGDSLRMACPIALARIEYKLGNL